MYRFDQKVCWVFCNILWKNPNDSSLPECLPFLNSSILYLEIYCVSHSRSSFHGFMSLFGDSLVAQTAKNLPAVQETQVQSLVQEDPLEKGMATHSCIFLSGVFHGQRSLGGYSSWGRKELDTTEQLTTYHCFKAEIESWRARKCSWGVFLQCSQCRAGHRLCSMSIFRSIDCVKSMREEEFQLDPCSVAFQKFRH